MNDVIHRTLVGLGMMVFNFIVIASPGRCNELTYIKGFVGRPYYAPIGDENFLTSNGSPDLIEYVTRNPPSLKTLLGQKTYDLKKVELIEDGFRVITVNGQSLEILHTQKDSGIRLDLKTSNTNVRGVLLGSVNRLNDGSLVGQEVLSSANTPSYYIEYQCNMVRYGVVRMDRDGNAIWRQTYATLLDRPYSIKFWPGNCQHYKSQQIVQDATWISPLPDGTFAISLGDLLIRVAGDSGLPVGPVPDLAVVESNAVIKFYEALQERLNSSSNRVRQDSILESESQYYFLQQKFFFPRP